MSVDLGMQLFTTLALLFGGALACGCAPFFLRVRESQLQTLAALGAGLMIGSALAVIVPEGFHQFSQAGSHGDHDHQSHHHEEHSHADHLHAHAHEEPGVPEGLAGLVLVLGFLTMLLLDHLQHAAGGTCSAPGHSHGHHHHHHTHSHSHGKGESSACGGSQEQLKPTSPSPRAASKKGAATDAATGTAAAATGDGAGQEGEPAAADARKGTPPAGAATDPQSAITGLLIHCAADGLAMGAAFLSGNARLTMLIAAAMVLHKAPMAFGLATYLMACGWGFHKARRTLVTFAAAAPAATLATYWLLGSLAVLSSPAAVALCVIFSGGTFLHAATMHILPEVLHGGAAGRMGGSQLAAVVAGSLLPVLLSWGHHH